MLRNIFAIEATGEPPGPYDPRELPQPGLQIVPTESPEIRRRRERDEAEIRQKILDNWDEITTDHPGKDGPIIH